MFSFFNNTTTDKQEEHIPDLPGFEMRDWWWQRIIEKDRTDVMDRMLEYFKPPRKVFLSYPVSKEMKETVLKHYPKIFNRLKIPQPKNKEIPKTVEELHNYNLEFHSKSEVLEAYKNSNSIEYKNLIVKKFGIIKLLDGYRDEIFFKIIDQHVDENRPLVIENSSKVFGINLQKLVECQKIILTKDVCIERIRSLKDYQILENSDRYGQCISENKTKIFEVSLTQNHYDVTLFLLKPKNQA